MNSTQRNSIILAIVLLIETIILKLAKNMRLWIYIAVPIIAGFAAVEFLKPQAIKFLRPHTAVKKRNLK